MLVIPLGVVGALLAAWSRGLFNDIYFQVGLLTTIGAEMVGGAEGLGNRLTYYSALIRMPQFFAIILILAILGISIYVFFFWLGKKWASWEA